MALIIKMENLVPLESLKGEELNIISFVMDYVEIHFNGPVIRALTNPIIETKEGKYQFPGEGSRDALCSFIGKKVISVKYQEGISVVLAFSEGEKITIPLDADSYLGPEAINWCPENGPMQVW